MSHWNQNAKTAFFLRPQVFFDVKEVGKDKAEPLAKPGLGATAGFSTSIAINTT